MKNSHSIPGIRWAAATSCRAGGRVVGQAAGVVLLVGAAMCLVPCARAQSSIGFQQTQPGAGVPPLGSATDAGSSLPGQSARNPEFEKLAADRALRANVERQRKMVEDANQLVAMANALKASVDKTTKNILSLDVMKQADEVERLAKSVKDKMRGQ